MRCLVLTLTLALAATGEAAAIAQQGGAATLREGSHRFRLQWITESPKDDGAVQISRAPDGLYRITGEQRKGDAGFATIDGILKVVSARELLFTGELHTRCVFVDEGRVCDRKGTFHFVAKGGRSFWRLQEMSNCDGSSTDYVDIYF